MVVFLFFALPEYSKLALMPEPRVPIRRGTSPQWRGGEAGCCWMLVRSLFGPGFARFAAPPAVKEHGWGSLFREVNMRRAYKTWAMAACAAMAGLGADRSSSAATVIGNGQSAQVDGWNITAPDGVSLTVASSGNQIDIEKLANFTGVNQGFQVGFQPVAGSGSPATVIDFTDEQIQNNTGSPFSGFQFILMNAGVPTLFSRRRRTRLAPSGSGYSYSSVNLNAGGDILSYVGTQNAGVTSVWGTGTPGTPGVGNPDDDLFIDVPSGAVFSLKELSQSGGGGGTASVPMPTAAWQSLAGLAGLALFGLKRKLQRRVA